MEPLNRVALIVTPKRRFLEWVNRLPDAGKPLTIEDVPSLRMVCLAATGDHVPPLTDLIEIHWEEIFDTRPLMVLRCCRELCARGVEESLTSAWNEE